MSHITSISQAKFPDSQNNLVTQPNGSKTINAPRYNDTIKIDEIGIEDLVSKHACNGRLGIINLLMHRIGWRGFWRASHAHIAELLGLSAVYVKKTLSRCEALGIFRTKMTWNGSKIYTLNPEFAKSGIAERLRPYFPGMRSLLSLIGLLSALPNCNFVNSIHASDGKVSTSIEDDLRALSNSYNYNINQQGQGPISMTTETESKKKEGECLKGSVSNLESTMQNKEFSFSKDTPIPRTPSEKELVEIRKKRTQAFLDNAKKEQQRRSPKRLFPGLSDECILIALSTDMTPWEAILMTSIPAEYAPHMLIAVHSVMRNSKIDSLKSTKHLTKKQESYIVYGDVFNSPKKVVWSLLHKEMKRLGLKFDYELATQARWHFGLIEGKRISMQEKSEGLQSLKALLGKLEVLDKGRTNEFVNNARRIKAEEKAHEENGYKIRLAHSEQIRQHDFKEDGDWNIRQSYQSKQTSKPAVTNQTIVVNDSPALAPDVQCRIDIENYRKSLSNMPAFLNPDRMRNNWNNDLKFKFPFFPSDFDILTHQI